VRKPILFAATFCIFSTISLADRDDDCANIVRYDERNSRIFVVCPTVTEMNTTEMSRLVTEIFVRLDGPPDEYFISFFGRADMVGYKTDSELHEHVSNGEWAKAYLGEYYTHSHEITLWPALPKKRVVRELPLP
jgi:hypothetical protein